MSIRSVVIVFAGASVVLGAPARALNAVLSAMGGAATIVEWRGPRSDILFGDDTIRGGGDDDTTPSSVRTTTIRFSETTEATR